MRQIVLDTETTGLEVGKGHRIVEIGCVELIERRPSGREFHRYVNPQRSMDEGARAVSGISDDFLADKPLFAEIAVELLSFIEDAELVMHNAAFDVGFLDGELSRLGMPLPIAERCRVLDTLALAREKYPGQKNSLDALCKRLDIDNSHRDLHGALLDAQLLAQVYLAMTAGQGDLGLGMAQSSSPRSAMPSALLQTTRPALIVRRAQPEEIEAHTRRISAIAKACKAGSLWPS